MNRPAIPGPIKREVRQQSGFGCVICGLPLYEYDHVIPYSENEEHDPGNIILLCSQHHREKTNGLLPLDAVLEAKENPHNLQTGNSTPLNLHYGGADCECLVGSNRHLWSLASDGDVAIPLLVDDTPLVLFKVEDEQLLLTVQLFDHENHLLVHVIDNELAFSVDPWDIQLVGQRLTVRHGPGDIFVGMSFEPPSKIVIDQGKVWRNGCEIKFAHHELIVPGENVIAGCEVEGTIGIAIGDLPSGCPAGICIAGPSRDPFQDDPDAVVTRIAPVDSEEKGEE